MKIGSYTITREDHSLVKGMVAGAVAGLVATFLKDHFQTNFNKIDAIKNPPQRKPANGRKEDPSTVKVANAVVKKVAGRNLKATEKELAGSIVDYGFGTLAGMAYGAVAELMPASTMGGGSLFGTALWLFADEGVVPAVGLAKGPKAYPAKVHANAFSGHIVYGLAAELVRNLVRKSFD